MRVGRLALVALLLVGVGAACSSKADSSSSMMMKKGLSLITQDGKATEFEVQDYGPKGFGPGDQLLEHAPITDKAGKTLGQSVTTATIVEGKTMADATGTITCTIQLAGGDILFVGAFAFKDMATGASVPVVGGTGTYVGAGGVVKMQAPDDKHTNLTFDLLLPETTAS